MICTDASARSCFNTQPPEGGWLVTSVDEIIPVILFQHTAARRRLVCWQRRNCLPEAFMFQHTAARRRLGPMLKLPTTSTLFQHTAARRRLALAACISVQWDMFQHTAARRRLDIQQTSCSLTTGFNTQPPEGGWSVQIRNLLQHEVSTHSRPKAAGQYSSTCRKCQAVSTHSRPKAAGLERNRGYYRLYRFNTQPPEGGWFK